MSRVSRHCVLRSLIVVGVGLVIGLGALAEPGVCGAPVETPAAPPREWTARLEALRPSDPEAYFELAEEVADVAETDGEWRLAARLFGLAGALDPERFGRSACLALADLEASLPARRRLLALASLLGGGGIAPGPVTEGPDGFGSEPSAETVMAVTEAFSHYRRGEGPRALTSLREPGAMELLEECHPFLAGGSRRFLEDCKHYRGQLRPTLSSADLIRMLRLEVALLAGDERSFTSELLLRSGRPLIEVDPERLEETLGVDPSVASYVNGRWVRGD